MNKLSGEDLDNIVWSLLNKVGKKMWLKMFNHVIINRENLSHFEWMIPEVKNDWRESHD